MYSIALAVMRQNAFIIIKGGTYHILFYHNYSEDETRLGIPRVYLFFFSYRVALVTKL